MAVWQVQDAKAHLSDVIRRAQTEGPQTITRHGREQVVVISTEAYRALSAKEADFVAHLLGGPKVDSFDIPRDPDTGRDIAF